MNLFLVLSHKWFDEVAKSKRIEYREITGYWTKRIWDKRDKIKTVTFSRGYTSTKMTFNVLKIDKGKCPYYGWDDIYFRIHFTMLETIKQNSLCE